MKVTVSYLFLALYSGVVTIACSAMEDKRDVSGSSVVDGGGDLEDTEFGDSDGFGCSGMDILFVVDDSSSMTEEQVNLADNFPKFIQVIEDYRTAKGEEISYRVGVTTTSVTRKYQEEGLLGMKTNEITSKYGYVLDGALTGSEYCGFPDPWIEGPGVGVTGQFDCAARVGIDGVYMEMPFAALELALGLQTEQGGANEGFYRRSSNSLLVVVFVTDEDDCSVENGGFLAAEGQTCSEKRSEGLYPVEDTKAFLDGVAGGEGRYVLVSISAPKKCRSKFGDAEHSIRLERLTELVGANGVMGDICQGDLWLSLQDALQVMETSCSVLTPI